MLLNRILIVLLIGGYAAASAYGGFYHTFTDNAELNRLLRDLCKLVSAFAACIAIIAFWLWKVTASVDRRIAKFEARIKIVDAQLKSRARSGPANLPDLTEFKWDGTTTSRTDSSEPNPSNDPKSG